MPRFDLNAIQRKHPEYKGVWLAMRQPSARPVFFGKYVDPRPLVRRLHAEAGDPALVIQALDALVQEGLLRQVYVVVDPRTSQIVSDEYESPFDIPDELFDFDRKIAKDEGDIVPLYIKL